MVRGLLIGYAEYYMEEGYDYDDAYDEAYDEWED